MSQKIGYQKEVQARAYLIAQGLEWLESNYKSPFGEIDLIMQEDKALVFVEVRARASSEFGGAIASVTRVKQQKIIKTALHYVKEKKGADKKPARFDLVCIEGKKETYLWIKDAFWTTY